MSAWKTAVAVCLVVTGSLGGEADAQHRRRHREQAEEDVNPSPATPVAAQVALTAQVQPAALSPQVEARIDALEAAVRSQPAVPPQLVARIDALETSRAQAEHSVEPPSDHSRVVGHLGIGLLGITSLPYPGATDSDGDFDSRVAIGSTNTVAAPTFGVRYWLRDRVGLDIGFGIGLGSSGGHAFTAEGADTPASGESLFALSLHAGLPLVLYHGRHYKFLAIPELNLGFASGGSDGRSATDTSDDLSYSGFMFEAGGRVGAEIHFGFIGLPFLALQFNVGIAVRYESRTFEQSNAGTTGQRFGLNSGRNFDLDSILLHGLGLILYLP